MYHFIVTLVNVYATKKGVNREIKPFKANFLRFFQIISGMLCSIKKF